MEDGDTDEVPIDDEEFDVIDEANELEERAPLLSFVPGENRGHALGKVSTISFSVQKAELIVRKAVGDMTDGIKTRNLMSGLGQGGGLKQLDVLKLDQLQKLGGAQGVDSKSNGLLGVLTGGNLLGKRDIVSDIVRSLRRFRLFMLYIDVLQGALQLTDTLGLNRRSGDVGFTALACLCACVDFVAALHASAWRSRRYHRHLYVRKQGCRRQAFRSRRHRKLAELRLLVEFHQLYVSRPLHRSLISELNPLFRLYISCHSAHAA